ncbi:hypothetical protein FSW04_10550 [Baekduia soli]|uniref:Uncharacterized protein n=1 Tax=Baekduia soli TaxID=496014 RepID=A0A5B8U4F1_9ACTN|nr:hypothetical protein [Baekduia soli]QEC47964.1 hypothetical protein FSW04_10550 [Baekduia soli]
MARIGHGQARVRVADLPGDGPRDGRQRRGPAVQDRLRPRLAGRHVDHPALAAHRAGGRHHEHVGPGGRRQDPARIAGAGGREREVDDHDEAGAGDRGAAGPHALLLTWWA